MSLDSGSERSRGKDEAHVPGGATKVEKYGWAEAGDKGEMLWIDKRSLTVDHSYQRTLEESKVKAIARAFNRAAFGVLTVARRPDGKLFVVEGQHRWAASLRRADVDILPCIVFNIDETSAEAVIFILANTNRRPVSAIAKHTAKVTAGDKAALLVDRLMTEHGRRPCKGEASDGVKCVGRLMAYAETDPDTLTRVWPLIVRLTAGKMIKEHHVCAVMYIEQNANDGASLMDQRWTKRLLAVGADGVVDAALGASRYYRAGGERIWAQGVVDALNHKLRSGRLSIRNAPNAPSETAA